MTHKRPVWMLIPVLLAVIAIPQLIYYWLAPQSAAVCLPVYCFGSVFTIVSPLVAFFTCSSSGLRKSAGIIVAAGILELLSIAVCVILLLVDATIRTSIFALSITSLVYLICLVIVCLPLYAPTERSLVPDILNDDNSEMRTGFMNDTAHCTGNQGRTSPVMMPTYPREVTQRNVETIPLPPRNR